MKLMINNKQIEEQPDWEFNSPELQNQIIFTNKIMPYINPSTLFYITN